MLFRVWLKKGSVWNRPLQYFSQPQDIRTSQARCSTQGRCPLRMLFRAWLKKGSVWNRPLQYFSQPRDVEDAVRFSPRPLGEGQGEGKFGAGRRPLRMPFLAWLQRRVGLEPTPTIFFSTTGRPHLVNSACFARTASLTSILSIFQSTSA